MKFLLIIDGNPKSFFSSLCAAKKGAETFINDKRQALIESYSAPAISKRWRFDFEISDWVRE